MVEGVIFDVDGLLINSEPFWRVAEIEVFGGVGLTLDDRLCRQTTGLRLDATVQYWFDRSPWSTKPLAQVADEIERRVCHLIRAEAMPMPGVDETFSFFEQHSLPIAVCSSSPYRIIDAVLSKLHLADRVTVVHSAEDETYGKPHPAAYLTTATKLAIAPRNCLVFEDALNGAIAAKAASMRVVAVPDPATPKVSIFDFCDACVPNLAGFSPALFLALTGRD